MEKSEQFILQKQLVDFIISDVFKTINEDDILKQIDGKWTKKGIPLPEGKIKLLKKEAEQFKKSYFYEVFLDEIRWHARNKLEAAQTEQDIISSKLLFYFCDLLNGKIKKLSEL